MNPDADEVLADLCETDRADGGVVLHERRCCLICGVWPINDDAETCGDADCQYLAQKRKERG